MTKRHEEPCVAKMADIEAEIVKLSPKPGDVLVIKVDAPLRDEECARLRRAAEKALERAGVDTPVIVCLPGVDVRLEGHPSGS